LTAISQFSDYPIPGLMLRGNLDAAKQDILDFFTEIQHEIPYEDTCLDVYWSEEEDRVLIIEFNVFGAESSAGLYSWRADREILMGKGIEEVDMRVLVDSGETEDECV
jgi:hypothetical protein